MCVPSAQQFNRPTAPYSITNRGLQFERSLLVPVGCHGNSILPLNCTLPPQKSPEYKGSDGTVPFLGLILDFPRENRIQDHFLCLCWAKAFDRGVAWHEREYTVDFYASVSLANSPLASSGLHYFKDGRPYVVHRERHFPRYRWMNPTGSTTTPLHFELMNLSIDNNRRSQKTC